MTIASIAEKARNSISDFCMTQCNAYCCRKGQLMLQSDEVDAVTQGKREELTRLKLLEKKEDGRYFLNFEGEVDGCPSLTDDFKCSIYTDQKRPQTCRDFPIFLKGNEAVFSHRCLAMKEGKFYPYIKQLKAIGCDVVESHFSLDVESFTLPQKR
jgi:Fe-S-cluster containining protein